jgi:hypothetical protein
MEGPRRLAREKAASDGIRAMNETIALLQRRRSLAPSNMTGPGPSAAEIETLLTIASRVPITASLRRGDSSCSRAPRASGPGASRSSSSSPTIPLSTKPAARPSGRVFPTRRWSSRSSRAPRRM